MDDKLENNSDRSQSLKLNIWLPSLGVWQWEGSPQKSWLSRPAGFDHRNVGNRNCTLGGYTIALVHSRTQGKTLVTS